MARKIYLCPCNTKLIPAPKGDRDLIKGLYCPNEECPYHKIYIEPKQLRRFWNVRKEGSLQNTLGVV